MHDPMARAEASAPAVCMRRPHSIAAIYALPMHTRLICTAGKLAPAIKASQGLALSRRFFPHTCTGARTSQGRALAAVRAGGASRPR